MSAEDEGKTEEPTGKRLGEAREKGSVVPIQDLQQSVSLLVGCLVLHFAGKGIVDALGALMQESFRAIPSWRPATDDLQAWGFPGISFIARLLLPVAVPLAVATAAISVGVNGWMFNPTLVVPDPSKAFRFSLARLFGGQALMMLGKAVVRMVVVGLVGWQVAWSHRMEFVGMAAVPFATQVSMTMAIAFDALLKMALVLVVLGIVDWIWQKRKWKSDLKMTKQEVKDEARQSEGDPHVKGKIRSLRREMHRRVMMHEVPRATVVVTNPTHYAVALRYRSGEDRAPVVVAKGADLLAARIRKIATEAGVPLVENPPLARALHAQTEPGDEIPSELYAAVAELLAMVMRTPRPSPSPARAALVALALCAVPLVLSACNGPLDSADPTLSVSLSVPDPDGEYRGGDVVVRADMRRCGRDSSILGWGFGRATVVSRGLIRDADSNIVSDTVVLRWDTLPGKADTVRKFPLDTVRYYVSNLERCRYAVTVRNVLPHVDSLLVGPSLDSSSTRTVIARSDTFVVAVHPGENAYLRFRVHDPDKNWPGRWDVGLPADLGPAGILGWRSGTPGDSVLLWKAPVDSLVDSTTTLWISDGLGGGKTPWRVRLCSYREQGSVWTGTRSELVKIALTARSRPVVVQRLRGFSEIVALDIDPVREGGTLVAADRGAGVLRKWTSTGVLRRITDSVRSPRSISCDVDGAYCWAGGSDSTGARGILKRVDGSSLQFASLPGPIQAVDVDQSGWGRAWFVSADSGFLGRSSGGKLDTLIRGILKRPVALSWDESTSKLWVADLGIPALIAFDSTGAVVHRVTSVHRPVSVWAGGGRVWVADMGNPATGGPGVAIRLDGTGTVQTRATTVNGPRSVVGDPANPDRAWIADTENGRLVLLSGTAEVVSTAGLGLDRPDVLAVHGGAP